MESFLSRNPIPTCASFFLFSSDIRITKYRDESVTVSIQCSIFRLASFLESLVSLPSEEDDCDDDDDDDEKSSDILLCANKYFSVAPGGPFGLGLFANSLINKSESLRRTCTEHVATGLAKSQSEALGCLYHNNDIHEYTFKWHCNSGTPLNAMI